MTDKGMSFSFNYTTQENTYKTLKLRWEKSMSRKSHPCENTIGKQ